MTFGNDKVITQKGFRPSYGIAEGENTKILSIPVKLIEHAIHNIANTGENKEKADFFKQFDGYASISQAMRAKYYSAFKKYTFYPG